MLVEDEDPAGSSVRAPCATRIQVLEAKSGEAALELMGTSEERSTDDHLRVMPNMDDLPDSGKCAKFIPT